jgi:hypothetical protein
MKTRTKLLTFGAVLALGAAGYAFTTSSEEAGPGFGPPFMHGGMGQMMGHRMGAGMMSMGHDSATMEQLGVIHELIANHDRIRRTVTNLPMASERKPLPMIPKSRNGSRSMSPK